MCQIECFLIVADTWLAFSLATAIRVIYLIFIWSIGIMIYKLIHNYFSTNPTTTVNFPPPMSTDSIP